jgi:hypothetical protein
VHVNAAVDSMKLSGRVQRLAGVASKPLLPARPARRSCRVAAVLQEDPKLATGGDQLLRARLEQLLPPSTRDNQGEAGVSDIAAKLPPRYLPEHKDAVWYLRWALSMTSSASTQLAPVACSSAESTTVRS